MLTQHRAAVVIAAALALVPGSVNGALKPSPRESIPPNFDIRTMAPAPDQPVASEVTAAVEALRAEVGPDAEARLGRRGALRAIAARTRPLTPPRASARAAVALAFLARHHAAFGLDREDVASLARAREAHSPNDRLVHLDFRQEVRGLRVFGTGVRVHLTTAGEIVRVSSTAVRTGGDPVPASVGAAEAVGIAVSHVRPDLATPPRLLRSPRGPAEESVFDRGLFASDLVASLELFPLGETLRTAWHVVVEPPGLPQKYDVLVDATTGQLLYRRNRVLYVDGVGKVLQSSEAHERDPREPDPYPRGSGVPGPFDATGGCPPLVNHVTRSLTTPFLDPATALFDTGRLEGNNTHVFRGFAGLDGAIGTVQPNGGWGFDFEFGSAGSAETHLFFVANYLHDFFYDLGFDEASGNFQVDNLGRGGLGGDALAVVSRADGRNNATFEPTADGVSSTLSMFLWDGNGCWAADLDADGASDLDGAFDSDIVIHEFHHGVSWRLNPFFSGDEADAMGEGGSDFFAYSINGDTSLAEYSYPPTGIRRVNGRTYGSWECWFGFYCLPHDNGEIWANVLWDLRERYRGDLVEGTEPAAIRAAHLLYVDGLKLSPPSPTMLDMRDAMLLADRLRHPSEDPGGSANACRIWEVFALRGMGAGALDTIDTGTTTVVESVAMPTVCPALPPPGVVTITASDAAASEAGGDAGAFTVARSGDTSRPLTVYLDSPVGTAGEGADYLVLPASVMVPAGAASVLVPVVPVDDSQVEADETVSLSLLGGPGYRVGTPGSAALTIASDDVAPDLVISTLTGPSTGGAGAAITVSETTKNQGNGASGAALVRYYLSSNTSVDAADAVLGAREVPALAVGASSTASVTLSLPGDAASGTLYVIARADAEDVVGEVNEANNMRYLVLRVGPDLAVTALTVPPVASAGATASLTDTVRNQGGGNAAGSVTAFFLSSNSLIDAGDVPLGTRAVPALAAGLTHSGTTTVTIPADTTSGIWYVLARADSGEAVSETYETNNVASRQVQVGADLLVSALTGPATAGAGSAITVSDTTKNQGGAGAGASVTRFFLSADAALGAGDVPLGSRGVVPLAPGVSSAGSTPLTIPVGTATGSYYVIAQADADGAVLETNEANNIGRLFVRVGPDLAVSSVAVPAVTAPGAAFNVTNAVKNQGGGAAPACSARVFLSANSALDAADVALGARAVPPLVAGATSSVVTSVTIPEGTPVGVYYVLVHADALGEVAETTETNNTGFASTRLGPDLSVTVASASPVNTGAGATITVSDTTANSGGAAGPATTTAVYFSANTLLDAGDLLVGSRSVPALPAGGTSAGTTTVTIPPDAAPGTWQLLVVADAAGVAAETNESNNARAAYVRVGPDLRVSSGAAPSKVTAGTAFSVTDTTANVGGASAAASATRYYLSTNTVFGADDLVLGARDVPPLAAGATSARTVSLTVPPGTAPRTYYLIMVADAPGEIAELYENNNALVVTMTVN
jgi:subtilase family serine protease